MSTARRDADGSVAEAARPIADESCGRSAPAAGNPLNLVLDDALDERRQIVVEPVLEHRLQHLGYQILKRSGILRQDGVRKRAERPRHGRIRVVGEKMVVVAVATGPMWAMALRGGDRGIGRAPRRLHD